MKKHLRWLPTLFFLVGFILVSYTLPTVNRENQQKTYFVQFRIIEEIDRAQSEIINNHMSDKSEINVSRTDFASNTYFAVLNDGILPDVTFFEESFKTLGYKISCFYSGEQFIDKAISPNILSTCTDEK